MKESARHSKFTYLYIWALQGLKVRSKRDSPYAKTPMYTARVNASPSINGVQEHTHDTLVGHISIPLQVEQHRHVILVVRSIEARNIDQGAAQAIAEVLCIQRWLPVITQIYCLPSAVCSLYPEIVFGEGEVYEREE